MSNRSSQLGAGIADQHPLVRIEDRLGRALGRWGPTLVLITAWVFLLAQLDLGWIPNDDGTLAHAADRVRHGEIPHLDFDEPYPGLTSFFNAAVFALIGEDLLSLRYPFWVFIGLWMLVAFGLARRVLPPIPSAITVIAMAGCVFLHMSPMPTWLILFLGTAAIYCVVKYHESRRLAFLFVAGLTIGVGALVKTNALLMAMAVGLALGIRAIRTADRRNIRWGRSLLVMSVIAASAFIFSAPTVERVLLLIGPLVAIVVSEWRPPQAKVEQSGRHPFTEVGVVACGVVVPVAIYTGLYWSWGAIPELVTAVALTPGLYIDTFDQNIPGIQYALATAFLAFVGWRLTKLEERPRRLMLVALVGLLLVAYTLNPTAAILASYTPLLWLGLFVGVAYAWFSRLTARLPYAVVVVAAGALSFQFVKFPTSNLYYLIHATPLVLLGLMMIIGTRARRAAVVLITGLVTVVGVLGVAKLDGRFFAGQQPFERDPYVALEMARGRLRVPESTSHVNELVVAVQAEKATGPVLAGPDSPEIYFLTETRNVTPVFFDFLSEAREQTSSTRKYLSSLDPELFINNLAPANSEAVDNSEIPQSCVLKGTFGPKELYVDCSR